jgi:hypothetical protein
MTRPKPPQKTAVHLLAGDWNAVLATTDRASG